MRRHAIGVIALVLLAAAGGLWMWPGEGTSWLGLEAACWRVGVLMGVLWVAYKDVERIPAWILGIVPPLLIAIAWKPRLILVVAPVILALAILRPRNSSNSRRKQKTG